MAIENNELEFIDESEVKRSKAAAAEVSAFLISFASDVDSREKFALNKEEYLETTSLSDEAKEILLQRNSNMLLRKLNEETAALLAVIVLETVTTEVVVL